MTTINKNGFPAAVRDQSIVDNSAATLASTTASTLFSDASAASSAASGEYNAALSAYTSICPVKKQKDLWNANKTKFNTYMDGYETYSASKTT